MYLYRKGNESQKHVNSLGGYFPDFLLYKNKNQFAKNDILKSNKLIKYNGNNNKNINTSINKKNNQYNKNDNSINYIYSNMKMKINNSHIIKKNTKNPESKNNINNNKNNNFSYSKNQNWKIFINKDTKNQNKGSNGIKTYKNNILNSSEKECISSIISETKLEENYQKNNKDYENEINMLIKEKEENEKIFKKQEKIIKKIEEDIIKLDNKIKSIKNENQKIYKKIETYKENEDQLIMLVKIIQKSGVDVEGLIDKWNEEIDNENNNSKGQYNNDESVTDSMNELNSKNSKISPASFIPINIEETNNHKKIYKGVPKLNFDKNKKKKQNQKKEKFRNNSK